MAEVIEGIILKSSDYQEKSKIVQVYTLEHGLIGLLVKGANSYKSRQFASTQPITHASFSIRYNKGLSTCYASEALHSYSKIKLDFNKSIYVYHLFELLLKGLDQHLATGYLFNLLTAILEGINDAKDEVSIQLYVYMFELKLLYFLGVAPILDRCVSCQTQKEIISFDIDMGGLVCKHCLDHRSRYFSVATIKMIRYLYMNEPEVITDLVEDTQEIVLQELRILLNEFYQNHLGIFTKSLKMLNK
ncbi:DNA repair protein RecO [Haloplasma contractile]|uniref:DNA repair protein RecO n=1 Tax=Haloplasma contractile SSD-17B TaxID=1033810 RepID=U2FS98_9MOLU|nr:DNA repair protein RecO [Haloplasma contractile]ERJ13819.1 DNA repair protein RecO [Haloplasma contractile SSD-17B]